MGGAAGLEQVITYSDIHIFWKLHGRFCVTDSSHRHSDLDLQTSGNASGPGWLRISYYHRWSDVHHDMGRRHTGRHTVRRTPGETRPLTPEGNRVGHLRHRDHQPHPEGGGLPRTRCPHGAGGSGGDRRNRRP